MSAIPNNIVQPNAVSAEGIGSAEPVGDRGLNFDTLIAKTDIRATFKGLVNKLVNTPIKNWEATDLMNMGRAALHLIVSENDNKFVSDALDSVKTFGNYTRSQGMHGIRSVINTINHSSTSGDLTKMFPSIERLGGGEQKKLQGFNDKPYEGISIRNGAKNLFGGRSDVHFTIQPDGGPEGVLRKGVL